MKAIHELFEFALEMAPEERAERLLSACGGDRRLEGQILELLHSDSEARAMEFWDSSALEIEARFAAGQKALEPGAQIGRYRLLNEIGRGGMGTVYRAIRDDAEYHKFAAVKVIQQGMGTDLIIDRFRTERQILAHLEHPNIARLLDGGTTEDGLPYLVMEYVEGCPIDVYAREREISIAQRLSLFQAVCGAVEYAHQNLVIHRDLKPGNILITEDGTPKLLDFGVAKLLLPGNPEGHGNASLTAIGFMTPEYASPEQFRGEAITTVSDVYSLGVLLYGLLTSRLPYRLTSRSPDVVAHAICTQTPDPMGTAATQVPGDLEKIVLMAIRKEPERRYPSARMFSDDIGRFLDGQPVMAHRDSVAYRASKFFGRHTAAVVTGCLACICLLAAMGGMAWEASIARSQRQLAEQRFNDVRKIANSLLFEFHDSIQDIPGTLKARQLLAKRAFEYLDNLARDSGDDLTLKAELAAAYTNVGSLAFDESESLAAARKSLAINEGLVAAAPANPKYREQLAASYMSLATLLREMGQSAGAVQNTQKAVLTMRWLVDLNPKSISYRAGLADAYQETGNILTQAGRIREALQFARTAMSIDEEIAKQDPTDRSHEQDLTRDMLSVARLESYNGDYGAALARSRQALENVEKLSAADPSNVVYRRDSWICHWRIGEATSKLGNSSAGLAEFRKALSYIDALSAADPGDKGHQRGRAVTHRAIADLLAGLHQNRAALVEYRKAIAISETLEAADPRKTETRVDLAEMYLHLGRTLQAMGKRPSAALDKASTLYDQAGKLDPANAAVSEGQAALRKLKSPDGR